jgi:hypothetical protein
MPGTSELLEAWLGPTALYLMWIDPGLCQNPRFCSIADANHPIMYMG